MTAVLTRLDVLTEEIASVRMSQKAQEHNSGQGSKRSLSKVRQAAASVTALRAKDDSVIYAMQLGDGDQHFDQLLHDGNGHVEGNLETGAASELADGSQPARHSISDPEIERESDVEGLALAAAAKHERPTVASRDGWAGGVRRRLSLHKPKPAAAQDASSSPTAQAGSCEKPEHGRPGRRHSQELLKSKHFTSNKNQLGNRSKRIRDHRAKHVSEYNLDNSIGEFVQSVYIKEQMDHKRIERHVRWAAHEGQLLLLQPHSLASYIWTFVRDAIIAVYAVFVPLHLAFADRIDDGIAWAIFSAGDAACWLGILVVLRTTVRLPGEAVLVAHPWAIFASYLRTWLLVDLVSALPWHLMMTGSVIGPIGERHAKWDPLPLFRLLGVVRLTWLLRIRPGEEHSESRERLGGMLELLKMSWHFLYLCHVSGCLYWVVAVADLHDALNQNGTWVAGIWEPDGINWGGEQEWLPPRAYASYLPEAQPYLPEEAHVYTALECYLFALNTGVLTMSGLVVMKPGGTRQSVISLMFTMATVLVQAVVIGSVTTVLTRIGANHAHERACRQAITSYCSFKEVPAALVQKIHDFYDYKGGVGFNEAEMMPGLPETLRLQLEIFHKRSVFLKVPFFQQCTVSQIVELVPRVSFEFATPGSRVVQEGMPVPGLYMIARGCIEVHVGSKIVAMRFAGEYVGETSLLQAVQEDEEERKTAANHGASAAMPLELRGSETTDSKAVAQASCVAHDWCELLLLRRGDFKELVAKHPELLHRIRYFSQRKDLAEASETQSMLARSTVMHRRLQEKIHEERIDKARRRRQRNSIAAANPITAARDAVDKTLLAPGLSKSRQQREAAREAAKVEATRRAKEEASKSDKAPPSPPKASGDAAATAQPAQPAAAAAAEGQVQPSAAVAATAAQPAPQQPRSCTWAGANALEA